MFGGDFREDFREDGLANSGLLLGRLPGGFARFFEGRLGLLARRELSSRHPNYPNHPNQPNDASHHPICISSLRILLGRLPGGHARLVEGGLGPFVFE